MDKHNYSVGVAGLALLLVTVPLLAQESNVALPIPGWHLYTRHFSPAIIDCINLSHVVWKVTSEDGEVQVTELTLSKSEKPLLPDKFQLEPMLQRGRRQVLTIDDGWLIGIDAGEWGGGLWLTNKDGSVSKEVVKDNVRVILPLGSEFLILTGLSHLSLDHGTALMLSNPHRMHAGLEWSKTLDAAPQAFTKIRSDSVLFTTRYGIFQINRSGDLTRLVSLPQNRGYYFWASSVAETADGIIYLGSRMFVRRFRPSTRRDAGTLSTYQEDWLLPDKCSSPCSCMP